LILDWCVFQSSSMYMQAAIRHGKDLGQSRLLSSGAKKLDTKSGGKSSAARSWTVQGSFLATHAAPSGWVGNPGRGVLQQGDAVFAGV